MSNQSLCALTRPVLAAAALMAASGTASAFTSALPDPFIFQTVNLQATGGTLVELPGVGPGGVSLFANQFLIDNFVFQSFDGVTGTENLTATFSVDFLDNTGTPVGGGAVLGGTFQVQFDGRANPFETGVFTTHLLQASFSGTTSLGTPIDVALGNLPTATISIQPLAVGFDINYLTPFSVVGQYSLDGGAPIVIPGLGDVNGQPAQAPTGVPEIDALSGTGALALLGFALALVGERRRRAAAMA